MRHAQPRPGAPAVMAYKQGDYKEINHYLRSGQFSTSLSLSTQQLLAKYADDLQNLMSTGLNTTQYPLLYRGTDFPEFGRQVKNYGNLKALVGTSHTWKGFVSTTYDIISTKKFYRGVVIFFHPSSGTRFLDLTPYRDLTKHNHEKEILLDHLTTGKITAVSRATYASGLMPYVKVDVTL